MSSPQVGISMGRFTGKMASPDVRIGKEKVTWGIDLHVMLDQTEFDSPFDRRPATVDVEFAVDTFGMRADGTQSDHKLLGDLRPGQFGFEQPEQFKLTLTERFSQIFELGFWTLDFRLLHYP